MTDEEKKKHACRFVDVDTSELWETLPEYSDATKTFEEFIKTVHAERVGGSSNRGNRWVV
jgi:hypothetical protein